MATNEELIKEMCSEDFNKFLFNFKIKAIASFLESGGKNIMDAVEQKQWLSSECPKELIDIMKGGAE